MKTYKRKVTDAEKYVRVSHKGDEAQSALRPTACNLFLNATSLTENMLESNNFLGCCDEC